MRSTHRLGILLMALGALSATAQTAGAASPGFADTVYVGSVTLGGHAGSCPNVTLAVLPLTVKTRSRIDGYGAGVYRQNGSDLNTVALHLELDDATNGAVSVSNRVPLSASFSGTGSPNNGSAFGAVSGVLYAGGNPSVVTNGGSTAFVARPGKYTLKLILSPASSPCPLQSFIGFITLSYQLAGTAP